VLDVALANLDGWEILGALKGESELVSTPIIICSTHVDRVRAENRGAASFVEKPFTAQGILEAVQGVGLVVNTTTEQAYKND
jgi:FixJ family two-component response regulator